MDINSLLSVFVFPFFLILALCWAGVKLVGAIASVPVVPEVVKVRKGSIGHGVVAASDRMVTGFRNILRRHAKARKAKAKAQESNQVVVYRLWGTPTEEEKG